MSYADDINTSFLCKTTNNIETILDIEQIKIQEWLCTNKLCINLSKTNLIALGKRKCSFMPKIVIDN